MSASNAKYAFDSVVLDFQKDAIHLEVLSHATCVFLHVQLVTHLRQISHEQARRFLSKLQQRLNIIKFGYPDEERARLSIPLEFGMKPMQSSDEKGEEMERKAIQTTYAAFCDYYSVEERDSFPNYINECIGSSGMTLDVATALGQKTSSRRFLRNMKAMAMALCHNSSRFSKLWCPNLNIGNAGVRAIGNVLVQKTAELEH